jgi:HD-like signal output (HDOD) protein
MAALLEPETVHDRARSTLNRIRAAIEAGEAPIISQVVQVIRDISGSVDKISIDDLADTISRDPTTMSRIISIAGSLGYNPNGVEITSVQQAIGLIGFERVRNLTVSLLLVQNAESSKSADASRELGGLSLISGIFACDLSRRLPGVEPDLAFVCSALRSYGRLLMSTFMGEDYAEAVKLAGNTSATPDASFTAIFGLTPLALGHELLSNMKLPEVMLESLHAVPEDRRKKSLVIPTEALATVADLGLRLAEVLTAPDLSLENLPARMEAISMEYCEELHLPKEAALELVVATAQAIESFGKRGPHSGRSSSSVRLFHRLECVALDREPPLYSIDRPPDAPPTAAKAALEHQRLVQLGLDTATEALQSGAEELGVLVREARPNLGRIFELTVDVLQNALHFESCVIFLLDRTTGLFHPITGKGPMRRDTRDGFVLRSTDRNVFSVPLVRGEDVVIENPNDPSVRAFIPEWLRRPGKAQPFLLLPIKDEAGPFALVCAASPSPSVFQLVRNTSAHLRRIRAHLALIGRFVK